ncbi:phosphopantetheine-binding protein [Clostridium perfringens]|uniref:acyl carrier protein n=1 Tax=Clostridium perfringens TaxID=1502 RepID=UPI0018E42AB3|nr:acyl carrier protein [Clostridium perfringens]MBI5978592.1 acyl carrier protein [Clostridium perfringens]MBI5981520.1 acyl carrier protein [Clostridium perfringens]MBI6042888.1 acyl carrier protein [Clostridium perfringens]MBI6060836.1 acyl carrier protein [Clostridium perfringens]MBI6077854.1 acyl carrier protein [Clostridium perfringens]
MFKIKEKVLSILSDNGYNIQENIDINELESTNHLQNLDSLQFITFICDIENEFDIEIPEENLIISNFESFNDFIELIYNLKNSKKEDVIV